MRLAYACSSGVPSRANFRNLSPGVGVSAFQTCCTSPGAMLNGIVEAEYIGIVCFSLNSRHPAAHRTTFQLIVDAVGVTAAAVGLQ